MTQPGGAARADDLALIERLRSGDEAAFEELVETHHASMIRLARMHAADPRVAEEAVQETWIAALRGLAKFEGRSSLKTWLCSILVNRAKTIAQREGRFIHHESLDDIPTDPNDTGVPADRFIPASVPLWGRHWAEFPAAWDELPEAKLDSDEARRVIQEAINDLPGTQREVITLRDIDQLSSEEACNILGITETNQRVLLHRARTRVRRALEKYLTEQ